MTDVLWKLRTMEPDPSLSLPRHPTELYAVKAALFGVTRPDGQVEGNS